MNISKTDLLPYVVQEARTTKAAAEAVINAFLAGIVFAVADGKKVTIRGFGTFHLAHRAERKVRNPATGAESIAPASSTLKFKAAKPK